MIYLQENKLTEYGKLEAKAGEAEKIFNDLSEQIKAKYARLNEIPILQKYISNYSQTREIYIEYRKSAYSKNFLARHENDINAHQSAKKYFEESGLERLLKISHPKQEYATVLAEKKKLYSDLNQAKLEAQKLSNVRASTDKILGRSEERAQAKSTPKLVKKKGYLER